MTTIHEVVELLDACELHTDDNGDVIEWYYFAIETGELFTFTADDAGAWDKYANEGGYSMWCNHHGELMDEEIVESLRLAASGAGDSTVVEMCERHLGLDDDEQFEFVLATGDDAEEWSRHSEIADAREESEALGEDWSIWTAAAFDGPGDGPGPVEKGVVR